MAREKQTEKLDEYECWLIDTFRSLSVEKRVSLAEIIRDFRTLKTFGERLKRVRENAGISQEGMSIELNLSQQEYLHIENGEKSPSLPIVKLIAITLCVSIDYLLGISDDVARR